MSENGLTSFIASFIAGRGALKLEAFDKDVQKKLAAVDEENHGELSIRLAEERQELAQRYEIRRWLTDAAARAGQISLVTHAAKFTHGDSKSSSVLFHTEGSGESCYLSSSKLNQPAIDAVGNAAVLDVAKFLQTECDGDSLVASLQRGDYSALKMFAESEEQLALWIEGFQQALSNKSPSSHKLAKQIYFPIGNGQYHLISPLFPSSLAHALHERIVAARFSDETKAANQARKEGLWHEVPLVYYPNTAVMNIGGTKPQNISYLNSVRGGRVWLLPCSPPQFKHIEKRPIHLKNIFQRHGSFHFLMQNNSYQLKQYLLSVQDVANTVDIRNRRKELVDDIIVQLFAVVEGIQREEWQGWTAHEECELKRAQQLWLDPYRCRDDEEFKFEREGGDWKKEVADDFALWLNLHLRAEALNMGITERIEWRTEPLFKKYIREFEWSLAEKL